MASEPAKSVTSESPSPDRLWAEQLAMGMALLVGLLIYMALFQPKTLSVGGQVLGPNELNAYGWMSKLGIALQLVVHEAGTLLIAWWMRLPLRFRFFPFGANAAAILCRLPRRTLIDAVVGLAGPLTGTLVSLGLAVTYHFTDNPLFLGMACVGYFYNLITLIPILHLEGGWIAPAIAPQAWLLGLVAMGLKLTHGFNLVLLCVVCFGLPRLILLIRARMPRADLAMTVQQRAFFSIGYFVLTIGLAWLATKTFDILPGLVRDAMSD